MLVLTGADFAKSGENSNQFYATFSGYDLTTIPDIPIVCRPLVNTSTRALAIETNPVWCLRVKHRGSWRTKTTPKVSIFAEGVATDRIGFSFRIPARTLYTNIEQVWADLQAMDFYLRPRNLYAHAVQRGATSYGIDELATLQRFNDERETRLKALRPKQPEPEDNVVDLVALLRERGLSIATDSEEYPPITALG